MLSEARRRFGSRVKELRESRKLTREGMLEATDLDASWQLYVESGAVLPSDATFHRLTEGLRLTDEEWIELNTLRDAALRAPLRADGDE